ncbi:hypothetical protein DAEQUDRAFT_722129 [Daedalea quercina L-15889]|uniref:Uncharacterized protein n=1 Tax=Daedalea quercina L-15889 TaxID=1314783 RepID=A0A165T7A3_9APHY|nr:hypothetical protein DAEQUDRAFT_722129 [Daedalea quercina L-15889]
MDLTRSPVQTRSRTRRGNRPPADSDLANSLTHSKDTRGGSKPKTTALAQQDMNILQHTSRLRRAANGEVECGFQSQVDAKVEHTTRAHSSQLCYVLVPPLRDVYPKAAPTISNQPLCASVTAEEPEIVDPPRHADPLPVDKGLAGYQQARTSAAAKPPNRDSKKQWKKSR